MEEGSGPLIIAMKGHPGTGKSTLSHALAAALKFPLLDKDDVRDCTQPLQHQSLDATSLNDLSYAILWQIAHTQLALGLSLVIDSPLSRRAHLDRLLRLAAPTGARVVIVECRPLNQAEWRRRLEWRGGSAGDASWHKPSTWQDLERLVEGYGGCTDYDVGNVAKLVVDTTAPVGVDEMVTKVLRFIGSVGVATDGGVMSNEMLRSAGPALRFRGHKASS